MAPIISTGSYKGPISVLAADGLDEWLVITIAK